MWWVLTRRRQPCSRSLSVAKFGFITLLGIWVMAFLLNAAFWATIIYVILKLAHKFL